MPFPDHEGRAIRMTIIKARPTLYKGIQMRSRLEADYAARLDGWGCRWEYEPECFASSAGQWLPDFAYSFADAGPLGVLCEVKPVEPLLEHPVGSIEFRRHVDAVLERMTIAWESRPDACLELAFWRYGGPAYLEISCARQGQAWFVHPVVRQMPSSLWVGMGQVERCRAPKSEREFA